MRARRTGIFWKLILGSIPIIGLGGMIWLSVFIYFTKKSDRAAETLRLANLIWINVSNIDDSQNNFIAEDIVDPKSGEVLVKSGRRITRAVVNKVKSSNTKEIELSREDLVGKVVAKPIIDESTGETAGP